MKASVRIRTSERKRSSDSRNRTTQKAEERIIRAALALPLKDRINLLEAIVKQEEKDEGMTAWVRKCKAKLELIRAMHPARKTRKER